MRSRRKTPTVNEMYMVTGNNTALAPVIPPANEKRYVLAT